MNTVKPTIENEKVIDVIKTVSCKDTVERRNKLFKLELALLQEPQVDIPVNHRFHGGMYAREITIPKGVMITGAIHKFDHFDIMLSGDITVSTDVGETKRLKGLNIMQGMIGKKRAGFAHEDTHWITFHAVEERDSEEMRDFLTCNSFADLENFQMMVSDAVRQLEQDEKLLTEYAKDICDKETKGDS